MNEVTDKSALPGAGADGPLGARARRAARKIGLVARRKTGRQARPGTGEINAGGYRLLDAQGNCVAGDGYTLSAEEVLHFCGEG